MATSYCRGWKIYYSQENKRWQYCDDDTECLDNRPCKRCGKYSTKEGYDACLGYVEGATSACCGHGVVAPYCVMEK